MENKTALLENISQLHTTPMGLDRIRRNLNLGKDVTDLVAWCRERICDERCEIIRNGKNWYCRIDGCIITVNAYSYTIITALKA